MPFANTVQIKPYNVDSTASYTFGNITVASNIATGNLTSAGRVTVTTGLFWSNGTAFSSGTTGISKPTAMFNYMFGG